jgi:selenocysteine lyase/cysteine desulfurase
MSTFPIDLVRSQFPALAGAAVFLDNPAGTQVSRQVINAVSEAMASAASNIGGAFRASKSATQRRNFWAESPDAR